MKNKQKTQFVKLLSVLVVFALLVTSCKDDDKGPALASPKLGNVTEITPTSFKASWEKVDKAQNYLLDVSKTANFSTKVTGYDRKEVKELNTVVTGLEKETKYFFRVYAKSGTITSRPSSVKEVNTIK